MPEVAGWTSLVVTVPTDHAETVSDALWRLGAAGIEEQDEAEGTRLVAGYPTLDEAQIAAAALAADGHRPELRPVTDDGADAWRDWAGTVEAGPFVVHPAWLPLPPVGAHQRLLVLEPGRTFGSGSHPTSRLVLAAMARHLAPGARVLDVGCGSGILAVGAALLGAAEVVAVDIDPQAPEITRANAAANGVGDRVTGSGAALTEIAGRHRPFDLVLANLLAPTIRELAGGLTAATAASGRLIVSGLLADRWAEPVGHLIGLHPVEVDEDDGWVAVTLAPSTGARP